MREYLIRFICMILGAFLLWIITGIPLAYSRYDENLIYFTGEANGYNRGYQAGYEAGFNEAANITVTDIQEIEKLVLFAFGWNKFFSSSILSIIYHLGGIGNGYITSQSIKIPSCCQGVRCGEN